MQFHLTWEMILANKKTQTRRPDRGEKFVSNDSGIIAVLDRRGHAKHHVGQSVPVQPGRGKPTIYYLPGGNIWVGPGVHGLGRPLRIVITKIRHEDVREISDADVIAEGFESRWHYLMAWALMHDRTLYTTVTTCVPMHAGIPNVLAPDAISLAETALRHRPQILYNCWAYDFRREQ